MSGGGHGARRYADALRRQNSSFGGLHHRRSSGLGRRSVVHRRKRRLRHLWRLLQRPRVPHQKERPNQAAISHVNCYPARLPARHIYLSCEGSRLPQ
ncbi:uncharacterized protein LOC123399733 [Hordeum vulgare subsp. vulgare]|uniref:uncharacterized protein LOC123399733 n=1 Tax=Hordeum vulgare subsp. vulgare TaxID=112509 RepID=UPI001D1A3E93|nr:uncharacterized protein LOC123399733 [Hordeum vulgare subsp. vulgare]